MKNKRLLASIFTCFALCGALGYGVGYNDGVKDTCMTLALEHNNYKSCATAVLRKQEDLLKQKDIAIETANKEHAAALLELQSKFNVEKQKLLSQRNISTSRGGYPDRKKFKTFKVTSYSPYDNVSGIECDDTPGSTSTGTKPKPGTIAVDPKVIPYGAAIMIIYEDGTFEFGKAEDCGGWVKGNHIDVFRSTYKEASKFGVQHATVLWYKEDKSNEKK